MSMTAQLEIPQPRHGGPVDLQSTVRQHPLLAFFILAFGFTWAIGIPMQAWQIAPLQFLVGWMPGLAALFVTGMIEGRSGMRALLRTLFIWRVGVQWYVVALFGFLVVWFGTQALNPLFGGTGIHLPPLSMALVAALIAELVLRMLLSSEQLAWSGFALPRLQARQSALVASLVLGVIWATWHLPLFFVPGSQADAGFGIFLVGIVCTRIMLTWVFNNTGGSVLLCGLLHQSNPTEGTTSHVYPESDWHDDHRPAAPLDRLLRSRSHQRRRRRAVVAGVSRRVANPSNPAACVVDAERRRRCGDRQGERTGWTSPALRQSGAVALRYRLVRGRATAPNRGGAGCHRSWRIAGPRCTACDHRYQRADSALSVQRAGRSARRRAGLAWHGPAAASCPLERAHLQPGTRDPVVDLPYARVRAGPVLTGFHSAGCTGRRHCAHGPDHLDVQQYWRESDPRLAHAPVHQFRHRCLGRCGIAATLRADGGRTRHRRGRRGPGVWSDPPRKGAPVASHAPDRHAWSARNRSTAVTRRSTSPGCSNGSFEKMALMCFSTARGVSVNESAITAFVVPSAMLARTSRSCAVSSAIGDCAARVRCATSPSTTRGSMTEPQLRESRP